MKRFESKSVKHNRRNIKILRVFKESLLIRKLKMYEPEIFNTKLKLSSR